MRTLDPLITQLQVVKEELTKGVLPLHDTLEGFSSGLKALPAGSPERAKFITQHMNHAPFLAALQRHPQGPTVHKALTTFLNSRQNAGFQAGRAKMNVVDPSTSPTVLDLRANPLSTTPPPLPNKHTNTQIFGQPVASTPHSQDIPGHRNTPIPLGETHYEDPTPGSAPLELDAGGYKPSSAVDRSTGIDRIKAVGQQPVIKADVNGQWSIEKADYDMGPSPEQRRMSISDHMAAADRRADQPPTPIEEQQVMDALAALQSGPLNSTPAPAQAPNPVDAPAQPPVKSSPHILVRDRFDSPNQVGLDAWKRNQWG